jgi:hypothetical protein
VEVHLNAETLKNRPYQRLNHFEKFISSIELDRENGGRAGNLAFGSITR